MNQPTRHSSLSSKLMVLAFFSTVIIAILIGILFGPDAWYTTLAKPTFNPPNWIFGPVWTVLYIMIAFAGWRIWKAAPKSIAMKLWVAQMILNWLWTPAFFFLHSPETALIIISTLLVSIITFITQAKRHDKLAAWLFIPYALWVSFALILNLVIAWMN